MEFTQQEMYLIVRALRGFARSLADEDTAESIIEMQECWNLSNRFIVGE